MKALKWIGEHFRSACVYFTVFQLVISAIFQVNAESGGRGQFLIFSTELILVGFSLVMAFAADIFKIKQLSFPVQLLLHFLSYLAAVFVLFRLVTGDLTKVKSLLFIMFGAAAVYLVCAAIVIIIRAVKNRREKEDQPYVSQFGEKK